MIIATCADYGHHHEVRLLTDEEMDAIQDETDLLEEAGFDATSEGERHD